jgi:hypothetical protein
MCWHGDAGNQNFGWFYFDRDEPGVFVASAAGQSRDVVRELLGSLMAGVVRLGRIYSSVDLQFSFDARALGYFIGPDQHCLAKYFFNGCLDLFNGF